MRIAAFLRRGGNGIEADVGEKDDGAAGDDPPKARGSERFPVRGIYEHSAHNQKCKNSANLYGHHHIVRFGRFPHSAD